MSSLSGEIRTAWIHAIDSAGLNPSLAPGWLEVAAGSLGRYDESFIYYECQPNHALSGVVPYLVRERRMAGMRMSVLELGSNLVSNHPELVTADDNAGLLRRFLDAAPRWDVFHASGIPMDGPTAAAIASVAKQLRVPLQVVPADVSPYLPIVGTWQEFLAGQNKKFRYKQRRRKELLQRRPDLELKWYSETADFGTLLKDMLLVEEHSWKVESNIDIASIPAEREYHRRLLPFLAAEGMLLANVLHLEQAPVAYSLCCHRNGWIGQLKTSFDQKHAAWSPGAIVIGASVEKAFDLGAREFDFLGDSAQHKLAWTTHARAHAGYFLFAPRPAPRLLGMLKTLRRTR
jgi:CelD/BcsL family acetyltransferase involved in cellulose biosynthesis